MVTLSPSLFFVQTPNQLNSYSWCEGGGLTLSLYPLLFKSQTNSNSYLWGRGWGRTISILTFSLNPNISPMTYQILSLAPYPTLPPSLLLYKSQSNSIFVYGRRGPKAETNQSMCLHFLSTDSEKFTVTPTDKVQLHKHRSYQIGSAKISTSKYTTANQNETSKTITHQNEVN